MLPSLFPFGFSCVLSSLVLLFPPPCCKRKRPSGRCQACVVVYIFRSVYAALLCVCASASSTYICAARRIAYLLGRGRFIECGRRRSDSHVFTSRQFFHLAPLPSRTRTFDVPGPLAVVWPFLPLSPFASHPSALSFGSVGFISRYPFVLYAT